MEFVGKVKKQTSGGALRSDLQSLTAEQATRGALAFCAVMKLPTKAGGFQNHAAADMAGGNLDTSMCRRKISQFQG